MILPFDQLAGGRDSDTAKNPFRLTDVNLFRRKINTSVKFSELRLLGFSFWPFQRERDLGIANVERVEKWLVMKKSGVVDVEHDLADEGERVLALAVTEDAHIARDQAAEWVEGEMAYRCFDAAPVQLFHDPRPCPPAKTFARQIPTAADCRREANRRGRLRLPRLPCPE